MTTRGQSVAFPLAAVLCILRGNECCSRQHGVSLLCALHFVSTHPQARAHTTNTHASDASGATR